MPILNRVIKSDFSLNFTVINATGTGQVAVKIFTPPDEVPPRAAHFLPNRNTFCHRITCLTRLPRSPMQFGKPMGDPKWFGGDVTEGFAVGAQVNVRISMLDASSDCWFCDDSEDPNPPLPVGGYVVQVQPPANAIPSLSSAPSSPLLLQPPFPFDPSPSSSSRHRARRPSCATVTARIWTTALCRLTLARSLHSPRKPSVSFLHSISALFVLLALRTMRNKAACCGLGLIYTDAIFIFLFANPV